jgi:hypothetical protein
MSRGYPRSLLKNELCLPNREAKVIFKSDGATYCLHNDGLTSDYPIVRLRKYDEIFRNYSLAVNRKSPLITLKNGF